MEIEAREFAYDPRLPDPGADLPLLVLADHTAFPGSVQNLDVSTPEARALVGALGASAPDAHPHVVLALQRHLQPASERGAIGILARVLKTRGHVSGNHALGLEALARVRIEHRARAGAFPRARVVAVAEPAAAGAEGARLFEELRRLSKAAVQYMPELSVDANALVDSVPDPGRLCDLVGGNLDFAPEERAALLAATDVGARLALAVTALERLSTRLCSEASALKAKELDAPWPFEPGARERMQRAVADGSMSADEAARLAHFAEKGYVVWERLIPDALVERLVADVRSIREHPGHFVATDHRNSFPYRYTGPDFDSYESIFDLYVNFESARAVCFHPTILRFLELLFEARPVAFQQLLFQRSNGHPLHQDTAYVCVDQALQLAASWVALEDVVQGRGELTYFEGSHRIPHHRFKDGSKRFHEGHDDPALFSRHIQEQIRALGCPKRDFLAKKGDVFLWAADLVHGSNPRTRPETETRMSCVTHYCPETSRPFWFRVLRGNRGLAEYGTRALVASSYYRLPKGPGLARPSFLLPERRREPKG